MQRKGVYNHPEGFYILKLVVPADTVSEVLKQLEPWQHGIDIYGKVYNPKRNTWKIRMYAHNYKLLELIGELHNAGSIEEFIVI